MKASERLSPSVVSKLKAEIEDAEGNEVFCAGHRDESLVAEIVIAARGGRDAVPALVPYLERGDVVIHNHPSGVLKASGPDLAIASFLGNQGIGFYIVDNEVERIYVCAEPVEKKRLVRMDGDELAAIISPGGALSRLSDSYECRASQVDMLREVARAFNDDGICVAEAGTGVGKSFAYLIPACVWAMKNDERVVVSTGTINLQQQLLDKDIPFVKKLLKSTIKTVLVKGRGNYLCLRRLEDALAESGLFLEEDRDLSAVADWAKITSDGSKTDLPFMPENGLWSRVNSEADFCLGIRCSRRDECFVLKARREAASAKVLVVNHHLLFSDLALRIRGAGFENSAVLPPFQRIIFDEAHNMESSATSFFSESLNKFVVLKILSRLYAVKRGRAFGVIVRLEALSGERRGLKDIPSLIEDVRDRMLKLDQSALAFTSESFTYRLKGRADDEVRSGLLAPIGEFQAAALRLIERLSGILEGLDDEAGENIDAFEARILTGRLSRASALCESFTRYEEDSDHIFWLERQASGRGESFAELSITPLSVAGIMEEAVFTPLKTVVCTSATLSVKDSFSYWLKPLGLSERDDRLSLFVFPSPFPYEKQVLLAVPTDAPLPEAESYTEFVKKAVGDILEISGGKGLVLFTSYTMLREVYEVVKPRLSELGITSLKQGDSERSRLLSLFKTDTASVLFATDSFWEGVDTPGEALEVVIICRLPFRVPTDPVAKARMEAIEQSGGNSFMDMSLPEAIIKLKQGFGRLMRRSTDRGVVVILDPRIVKKSYGPLFLETLPKTRRSVKEENLILRDVENFFFS